MKSEVEYLIEREEFLRFLESHLRSLLRCKNEE